MKKVIAIALPAVICLFILSGCSKFEDGPKFSILSKKARLCNKTWTYTSETYLGTGIINTSAFSNNNWEFTKEGDFTFISFGVTVNGTWEFSGDTGLIITYLGTSLTYKIMRLTSKELKLRDDAETVELLMEPK